MLISGTRFRYIYPQDTVNWLFNLRPVSTGVFNFNFHSNSGNIFNIFSIENRKIYSPSGDFVGSYETNSNLNLSGNISNNRIDLYNNAGPLYLGLPIQNYDKITGFSLNSIGGQNINFLNLSILGDAPEYFYDEKVSYRSGELIKINIINNSDYNFTIFSGRVTNNNFTVTGLNNLSIEQNNSGYFYLINSNNIISLSNTNIILDTDFGTQELRVTLSGIRLEDETYYLSFGPNILYVENNYYKDYNIVFRNADSANLSIQLKYISGLTGDYYRNVPRTAFVTNQDVSGFITGSGFLYSNVTGLVSGFNPLRNYYEYGTGSGIVRDFKIAEDQYIEKNYTVLGSGLGNIFTLTDIDAKGIKPDILYTGFLNFNGGFLTGFFSGIVTGIVPDARRGWYLDINGNFVPPPISEENYNTICNFNPSNSICSEYSFVYQNKTGLKTGLISKFFVNTGDVFVEFDPSDYENINLVSPLIFVTGKISGFFNITGAAFATGSRISGKLIGDYPFNFEPGIWNIYKPYVGKVTGESFLSWNESGEGFDPIIGEPIYDVTTGNFSGIISLTTGLDFCNPVIPGELNLETIPEFVSKSICFENDDIYHFQYSGFVIQPLSGEEKFFENSFFQIASGNYQLYPGHPTGGRTRISRLGQTPSGSGQFFNVFESINFQLPIESEQRGAITGLFDFVEYNGNRWEEQFSSLDSIKVFDSGIPPSITDIDIECNILYPCDTTIIGFTIEPPNFYNFKGTGVQDCWSGCFSNWPRKLSSIESSGNIISLDTQSVFTSDGFSTSLEFYICDIDLILFSSSSSSSSLSSSSSSSSVVFTSSSSSSLTSSSSSSFDALAGQFMTAVSSTDYTFNVSGRIFTSYNYGATWIDRTNNYPYSGLRGVAISQGGKYQIAADYPNKIFISNNSGVTWSPVSFNGENRGYQSVAISANGQYQAATMIQGSSDNIFDPFVDPNPELIISSDFGQTWESKLLGSFRSVSMSSDGRYITAVSFNGGGYVSDNYGETWSQYLGVGPWTSVSISEDGKYQTACSSYGPLVVSNNYGVSWFNKDSIRAWYDVSVGGNGQYQAAAVYLIPGLSDRGIYISNNYGETWVRKLEPTVGTPAFSIETYNTVAISSNGKYIAAGRNGLSLLLSEDFGENWRLAGTPGASWADISINRGLPDIIPSSSSSSSTDFSINCPDGTNNCNFITDMHNLLLFRDPTQQDFNTWLTFLGDTSPGSNLASIELRTSMVMEMMGWDAGYLAFSDLGMYNEYQIATAIGLQVYGRLGLTPGIESVEQHVQAIRGNTLQLPINDYAGGVVPDPPYGATYGMAAAIQQVYSSQAFQTAYPNIVQPSTPISNYDFAGSATLGANPAWLRTVMFNTEEIGDGIAVVEMMNAFNPSTNRQGGATAFYMRLLSQYLVLAPPGFVNAPNTAAAEQTFQKRINSAALQFLLSNGVTWNFAGVQPYSPTVVQGYIQQYWGV